MDEKLYRLASGVSARNESFGLLFYCADDTNLTFVKSKDLLDARILSVWQKETELCGKSDKQNKNTKEILSTLVDRGLLLEK